MACSLVLKGREHPRTHILGENGKFSNCTIRRGLDSAECKALGGFL